MESRNTRLETTGTMAAMDKEITVRSMHWSRLIAGTIFIVTGLLDLHALGYMFGGALGEYIGTGVALVLGGVSFFWLIGMPIMITGGILVLYFMVSTIKYTFTIDLERSTFVARERWFLFSWTHHVSPVTRVLYQHHRVGPKAGWIAVFACIIVLIVQYGGGMFDLPRSVSNVLPTMMVFTAICDGFAVFILVYLTPASIRVFTVDRVHDFWVSCPPRSNRLKHYFEGMLHDPQDIPGHRNTNASLRMVVGMLLCAISLLGLFGRILFGEWFSMAGLMYGLILVVEGIFIGPDHKSWKVKQDAELNNFTASGRMNRWTSHVDIKQGTIDHLDGRVPLPAWHAMFIVYLLASMAIQVVVPLKAGALTSTLTLIDFFASITLGAAIWIAFHKLVKYKPASKAILIASLVIGVIIGLLV